MLRSCCSLAAGAVVENAVLEVLVVASIAVEGLVDTGLDVHHMVADPSSGLQEVVAVGIQIVVVGRPRGGSSLTFCTQKCCFLKN